MIKTIFEQQHLTGIQTLRGLAAFMVVLEHIRFLSCGAFGVDIFFCISGFMIMLSTHENTQYFLRKRLLRIVPFYALMTIGSYLLMVLFPGMFEQSLASFDKLVKSLLFIPFDMGNGILQPLLRIGWTVNCEILFYLLFFLAFHISHKYRGLLCSLFLLGFVMLGAFVSGGATFLGTDLTTANIPIFFAHMFPVIQENGNTFVSSWLAPLFFYGNPVMLEFILGILCYYIVKFLYDKFSGITTSSRQITGWGALLMGGLLFVYLIISTNDTNIVGYHRLLHWGLPVMLLVILFCLAGLCLSLPKPLIRLGDISFSLYLIHYYPIMFLDRNVFDFATLRPLSFIGALLGITLVLFLSMGTWYFVEKKLTGWLRMRILPAK